MESVPETELDIAHEIWYDPEGNDCLTLSITRAVSEVADTPMEELPPLQYSIDTDSLENLFCPLSCGEFAAIGEVNFVYGDYFISVHSTGSIRVYDN